MPITKARLKISDYNQTRKSRLNKEESRVKGASLTLTSLVDVFAILVIFLLSNTSTVAQWIEVGHGIQLPRAKFSDPPPKALTLQVSKEAVFVDDKAIVTLAQVNQGATDALKSFLAQQTKKDGYVNIIGHEKLPFGSIRRVVAACQDAGFANINLAVQPK